jgi:carboxypeptidase Taq
MQGIPHRLQRSILAEGASAGLHESQSRLWENVVGRSRYFWQFFLPAAKAMFPAQFGDVDVEDAYRAANVVEPSFIRVEADEVTYNLHIMIRFELEKAVFAGEIALPDLRDAWNAKFEEYLGITPPDDLLGVLQDIHWSGGFGGSFQGYTIGNVTGVALYAKALAANPSMHSEWSRGNFSTLLRWMQDNVHTHGAKFEPDELLRRVTGEGLTARPYLDHIKAKYTELYRL